MDDQLETLSRHDLQQRAKALGIKANQKSSDLIAAIRERSSLLRPDSPTSTAQSPSASKSTLAIAPYTPKTPAIRKQPSVAPLNQGDDEDDDIVVVSTTKAPPPPYMRMIAPPSASLGKTERPAFRPVVVSTTSATATSITPSSSVVGRRPMSVRLPRIPTAGTPSASARSSSLSPSGKHADVNGTDKMKVAETKLLKVNFGTPSPSAKAERFALSRDKTPLPAKPIVSTHTIERNENERSINRTPGFSLKDAMRAERERRRQSRVGSDANVVEGAYQWERVESRSKPGLFYFWNATMQQARWELPEYQARAAGMS